MFYLLKLLSLEFYYALIYPILEYIVSVQAHVRALADV